MGWNTNYKSDIGEYQALKGGDFGNAVLSWSQNFVVYARNLNLNEPFKFSNNFGGMGFSAMAPGTRKMVFGFRLYNANSEPLNKFICAMLECRVVVPTGSDRGAGFRIQWAVYDSDSDSFSYFSNYMDTETGFRANQASDPTFDFYFKILKYTYNSHEYTVLAFATQSITHYSNGTAGREVVFGIPVELLLSQYRLPDITEIMESPEFGPASLPGGGYNEGAGHGSFDNSSDIITHSGKPLIGVTTAGFINVYKITQGQLNDLGAKLFPSLNQIVFGNANPTTEDILMLLAQIAVGGTLTGGALPVQQMGIGLADVLINGKLIDYILDCHVIPCSISGATVEGLKVGYRQFNDIQVARATEDYVEVDCGSLSIPEYWGNFLDFANVRCKLYLPFYGFIDLEPEAWNGGTISVKYIVNIVDGSFQALVYSTSGKSQLNNSLIGQYGGTCCVHYPITGLQYSNVISGLITAATGAAVSAAAGDMGGAVSNAGNIANLRPMLQKSNSYNASNSFLSHRKPYLLIERCVSQFSVGYQNEKGLPLNVYMNLANVHGFTVIEDPVINIDCTEAEHDEIVRLMKEGIIL